MARDRKETEKAEVRTYMWSKINGKASEEKARRGVTIRQL